MTITLHFQYRYADFVAAAWSIERARPTYRYRYLNPLLFLGGAIAGWVLFGPHPRVWVIGFLGLAVITFIMNNGLVPHLEAWMAMRRRALRGELEIVVDNAGITLQSAEAATHLPWSQIISAAEMRDAFRLHQTPDEYLLIPKRAFADAREMTDFTVLLARKQVMCSVVDGK